MECITKDQHRIPLLAGEPFLKPDRLHV